MSAQRARHNALAQIVPLTGRHTRSFPGAFADEHGNIQAALALEYSMRSGVPTIPRLQVVREGPTTSNVIPLGIHDSFFDRQPTADDELPEPKQWVARLTQALLEVWQGKRPIHQLARWMSNETYAELMADARHGSLAAMPVGTRCEFASKRHIGNRIARIRAARPANGIVEASVVVSGAFRTRAIALRLEGLDGRWLVTELALV